MSRFYVISPNVDAKGNSQTYLEEMFNRHIILMGWGPDNQFGRMFENMEIGDYVICAQGANQNKQLFFAGMISSKSSNEWPYSRILTGFVDLREETIEFNSDNAYGNASRIPAIYELKQNNNADYEICNNIKRIVDKMKNEEKIKDYTKLLESNHNLILTGAPGTGKTYLAKEIAKEMGCSDDEIGFVQFHPSFDYTDFVEGLRPKKGEDPNSIGFERKDGVFKEFCKNALSTIVVTKSNFDEVYSKFIEDITENGLTLKTPIYKKDFEVIINSNNNLFAVPKTETATHMSITKEMMKDYMEKGKIYDWKSYVTAIAEYIKTNYDIKIEDQQNINKKYVFIIDEINRGEISKIFGELFFSIDPGYRGVENGKPKGLVKTQYQNLIGEDDEFYGGFYIPENVYIIGTMNDIDRSVESMDFAFRRRFAFKEIKADENVGMLDILDASVKDKAINRMKNLNNAISPIEGLSSAYHIGGSYFLKLKNYDNDFEQLWDYHIEGLLREYLRGNPEIEKHISDLKAAYNNEN